MCTKTKINSALRSNPKKQEMTQNSIIDWCQFKIHHPQYKLQIELHNKIECGAADRLFTKTFWCIVILCLGCRWFRALEMPHCHHELETPDREQVINHKQIETCWSGDAYQQTVPGNWITFGGSSLETSWGSVGLRQKGCLRKEAVAHWLLPCRCRARPRGPRTILSSAKKHMPWEGKILPLRYSSGL